MNKWQHILIALLCMLTASAQGATLLQTYRHALESDPTYRAAEAAWLAGKEDLPISRSALLPQFGLHGRLARTYNKNTGVSALADANLNIKYYSTEREYGLNLTQSLFNVAAWWAIKRAGAEVKQATATFNAAAQDLMLRVAIAYFRVLEGYDDLSFTKAEKAAVKRQLEQTQERFRVGLIAITDVYEARARYKSVVAQEIRAKTELANRLEELREITNRLYPSLKGIRKNLPLITPRPTDINQWVKIALKQNYLYQASYYASLAARQNIRTERAGRYPVLNVQGSMDKIRDSNLGGFGARSSREARVGAIVDFPVYQGGFVSAKSRQAIHFYDEARSNEERTYRAVVAETRKSYLGVLTGISEIRAQSEAIFANQSALKAIKASYSAGTRTLLDVLIVQTNLYDTFRNYARSQYAYLLNILRLKRSAGTLSGRDLAVISNWLKKSISFKMYPAVIKKLAEAERRRSRLHLERPRLYTLKRKRWHHRKKHHILAKHTQRKHSDLSQDQTKNS